MSAAARARSIRVRALDPESGFVEYEYDHVLTGVVEAAITVLPDPAEVADIQWIESDALGFQLANNPRQFAPWLPEVVRVAAGQNFVADSKSTRINGNVSR
jgi:isopentenyl-diphosphate delta-isomerase